MVLGSAAMAQDGRLTYPQQYTMSPKGVNMQTGRFTYSHADLSIGDLTFTRKWGDVPSWTANLRSLGVLNAYSSTQALWPNLGWSHNFNEGVTYLGNGDQARVYVVVDGQSYSFIQVQSLYGPTDEGTSGANLGLVNGQWVFTDQKGAVYTFYAHPAINQSGTPGLQQVLQNVVYADGSRIDYSYNASAAPKIVKSNRGYALVFDYDANGNVSTVCGVNLAQSYADTSSTCASSTLKVGYSYDSVGRNLTAMTDPLGRIVSFSYTTIQNSTQWYLLSCISLANSGTCEIANTYGPASGALNNDYDQVLTQTTATGALWQFSNIPQPDPQDQPVVTGQPRYSRAQMIDPTGAKYGLKFDRGHLVERDGPDGTMEYRYDYLGYWCCGGPTPTYYAYFDVNPDLAYYSTGIDRIYTAHDSRNNITQSVHWPAGTNNPASTGDPTQDSCCITSGPVTAPAGSVINTQTFLSDAGFTTASANVFVVGCGAGVSDANLCDKPMSRTDANGNETDFTYASASGLLLTETGPADGNGVRPQTRYTYAQRYAWVAAAGGGYTQGVSPIWLLTQKSSCRTGAASGAGCAVAGDEVRTLYDYGPDSGPNNLLLRGTVDDATGVAVRTCFGYDARGNKISETKPRAALTSCP
jgi:hypothetical protein